MVFATRRKTTTKQNANEFPFYESPHHGPIPKPQNEFIKTIATNLEAMPQTLVFPQTLHTLRPNPEVAATKSKKRDNIFSKSRDTREDRGTREMKTSHNAQSFQHGH
jgi:hypothetical protein